MMNGLVIRRGEYYLARKGTKSARPDASGNFWSKELQAARVFMSHDAACRAARKFGGVVRLMRNGRTEE
jgi:hypothetical protein